MKGLITVYAVAPAPC